MVSADFCAEEPADAPSAPPSANAAKFVMVSTMTTAMNTARHLPSNVFLRSSIFSNMRITHTSTGSPFRIDACAGQLARTI